MAGCHDDRQRELTVSLAADGSQVGCTGLWTVFFHSVLQMGSYSATQASLGLNIFLPGFPESGIGGRCHFVCLYLRIKAHSCGNSLFPLPRSPHQPDGAFDQFRDPAGSAVSQLERCFPGVSASGGESVGYR